MKTFKQWSLAGYKINKGSKGTKVGKEYYFSENQVTYSPKRSYYSNTNLGDHKGFDNPHFDYRYGDFDYDDNSVIFD